MLLSQNRSQTHHQINKKQTLFYIIICLVNYTKVLLLEVMSASVLFYSTNASDGFSAYIGNSGAAVWGNVICTQIWEILRFKS